VFRVTIVQFLDASSLRRQTFKRSCIHFVTEQADLRSNYQFCSIETAASRYPRRRPAKTSRTDEELQRCQRSQSPSCAAPAAASLLGRAATARNGCLLP